MAEPTLEQLRERLRDFQEAYTMCDFIDHWPDVLRCRTLNQTQIDRLKKEIARRESEDDERQAAPATLWPAGNGEGD